MNGDIVRLPNGLDAIEINGVWRVLAKLPPDARKRAAAPSLSLPVLAPSDWRETNRRPAFGDEFVLDQQAHGSCTGFGSTGALMKMRAMSGMTFERLSGAYVYSWINGNRDDGAMIHDTLATLQTHGTCLESEVGWNTIYRRQIPASADQTAQRFRIQSAETIDTWDEFLSALTLGFVCPTAVMVGSSFNSLDSDGIVGFDRGPGNHCVHFFDVFKTGRGEWAAWGANSWGTSWGRRGYFGITQRHFEGVQQDCYRITVETEDPQDTAVPPVRP